MEFQNEIQAIIDRCEAQGIMTQAEHDRVIRLIHRDGKIDAEESEQLSRMFSLLRTGKIRLTDGSNGSCQLDKDAAKSLAEDKRRAVERDLMREDAKWRANLPVGTDEEKRDVLPDGGTSNEKAPLPIVKPSDEAAPKSDADFAFFDELGSSYSLGEYILNPGEMLADQHSFHLTTDRFLRINLAGKVWIKTGAMAAYCGIVKFTREGFFEHGVKQFVKRQITDEGRSLTKATGQGTVYVADQGKKISLIDLKGNSIIVNGHDLLAFEESVKWDIVLIKSLAGMWAGGLFNMRLAGLGMVAISTHYDPITLRVLPHEPVMTDPNCTVAWSGNLKPEIKTDVSADTLIGRTSGETLQLVFRGDGFVVIQPYEEIVFTKDSEA